ncbi:uncharacterized protein LOC108666931 [Hyalella azteca]|uniref:Uncharacterized protein LOC108666931 n=1 Tax=Hyalella azteca TaxID=294128 RepID=A0A8B7N7X8_HYAAZ|nr:uncharacterized protein LOC108666931 [Hyalella azteca]
MGNLDPIRLSKKVYQCYGGSLLELWKLWSASCLTSALLLLTSVGPVSTGDVSGDGRVGVSGDDIKNYGLSKRMDSSVDDKVDERVDDRVDGRVDEKGDEKVDGRVDDKVDERVDDRVDGRVDDKVDERVDDRVDGRVDDAANGEDDGQDSDDVLVLEMRRERLLWAQYTTSTRNALLVITSSTLYTCLSVSTAAACTGRRQRLMTANLVTKLPSLDDVGGVRVKRQLDEKRNVGSTIQPLDSSKSNSLTQVFVSNEIYAPNRVNGSNEAKGLTQLDDSAHEEGSTKVEDDTKLENSATFPRQSSSSPISANLVALDSSLRETQDLVADPATGSRSGKSILTVWSTVSSTKTVTTYLTNTFTTVSLNALCTVAGITIPACG